MTVNRYALDLFCGAGGLSLGAEMAGIKIKAAIENDPSSILTYKRNHPGVNLIQKDIREVQTAECGISQPFIIMGGPPCQGFSLSNKKTRTVLNTKNYLFREFVRYVQELKPDWFLFENVEGIVNFNKGKTIAEIRQQFSDLGYSHNDAVLFASDYGVPQNRNRFFLVGNKHGIEFKFPKPSKTRITVWEAIADLPRLENGASKQLLAYKKVHKLSKYAQSMRQNSLYSLQNIVSKNDNLVIERYKYIKQGQNWRAVPKDLMANYSDLANCHSGIYRRLKAHKPSIVISNYRKNMLIHPYQNRGLSIREAARIQSFPDSFVFEGSIWYIQQQIGNAVPPLMAKAIFKSIISQTKK